ncbi:MAG: hypothetical protein Q4F41_06430 [Eubacteriales bacterium]|nr:hypothetical protein [Eubacteriales bacterium]
MKKSWKRSSLIALFFLAVCFCTMPLSASAAVTATINGKGYDSLQDAVANVKDGQTIVLKRNTTECVTAARDVKYTIDLNKKTWTGKNDYVAMYVKSGTITLKNGKMTGEGGVLWVNGSKAKVTISSGTYTSKTGSLLYNSAGTLLLKNGTYKAGKNVLVNSKTGTTTIYKGTYTGAAAGGNYSAISAKGGTVTIKNGTISGNGGAVSVTGKEAKVTLANGTYTSKKGTALYNSAGTLLVKKGTYKAGQNVLMNCGTGKTTISGGKFSGTNADYAVTFNKGKATLKITAGTFTGKLKKVGSVKICLGIYQESGTVKVSGGKLNGKKITVLKVPSR